MRTLALLAGLFVTMAACAAAPDNDGTRVASDELAVDAGAPDDVQVIVEPSDKGAALVAAIIGATKSVHMTMYDLSAEQVINALVARHQAGVEVKVILNGKPAMPGPNPNQKAFDALQSAGVPVVWSPSEYEFTHEKCVVIDGATAWIMTMNASESSPVQNREYLGIDDAPDVIVETEAQFAADFADTAYTPTGPLLMSPVTMRPGLQALIASATTTLDFEVEELNDADFAGYLCAAVAKKVAVRGLLSTQTLSDPAQKALDQLKGCGVAMGSLASPYIHAKAIVVDGVRAYIGSANFSTTSLDHNRELGLVSTNPTTVATIETSLTADIGNGKPL